KVNRETRLGIRTAPQKKQTKKRDSLRIVWKIGTAGGENNGRYFYVLLFCGFVGTFLGILTESYAGSGLVQMILRIVY
ncbi:MAG: hypothetical protein ACLTTO_06330, partial [Lachnospiraceae bacterium]